MDEHLNTAAKVVGDLASIGIVIGTLAKILPSLAALVTFIWYGIRISEWAAAKWNKVKP